MSYEYEQRRLEALMDEVLNESDDYMAEADDDAESFAEDNVEILDTCSNDFEDDVTMENDVPLDYRSAPKHKVPIFIAKNGTKWRKHAPNRANVKTRSRNIVATLPGPKGNIRHEEKASSIWGYFFTDSILDKIVYYTNIFIQSKEYDVEKQRSNKPTDRIEIKALLGLLYIAGVNKIGRQNYEDLFRTDGMAMDIFRLTMSVKRFSFLLRHLRFDNKVDRIERQALDKMAAFREIFEEFVENLPKHFNPSFYTTIDEILTSFRGHCSFRVYMPSKPNRYGLKIYALVDSKLFYTMKLEVYLGKQPEGPYKFDNSNLSLVCRLVEPIRGSNRNITMDNFFTSVELADKLLMDYKLTIIGTLRKNKPHIPRELLTVKRPQQTSMFAFQENCTMVSYIPRKNKNVILLSTVHLDDAIDFETGKPDIIVDYNKTKGGVDIIDQMSEAYNCARATRRWPMVLFYELLNIAGINAFRVYKLNHQTTIKRRTFLEAIGRELVEGHLSRRATKPQLPREMRLRLAQICNRGTESVPANNEDKIYGRCAICDAKKNRKTKYQCLSCRRFLCLEHVKPMCANCFEADDSEA